MAVHVSCHAFGDSHFNNREAQSFMFPFMWFKNSKVDTALDTEIVSLDLNYFSLRQKVMAV